MRNLHFNIPISKVDEEQRMVWGYATTEDIDSQNDIVDYQASKKAFSEWLGNIREMHNPIAVGKAIDIQYDDVNRKVMIGAKISESADGQNAWQKVKEGVLTGFSIGGRIFDTVRETVKTGEVEAVVNRIRDYALSEVSLVDNPANPQAQLVMVKSMNGGLQRVEVPERVNNPYPQAWWQSYLLPIEKGQKLYNESREKIVQKSVYGADFLIDLACSLSSWISGEEYSGEDMSDLKTALTTIKQAAIGELQEPESDEDSAQDLSVAVELAQKTLDLRKDKSMLDTLSKGGAFVEGEEPRDDKAQVITPVTASPNAKKAGYKAPAPIKKSSAVVGGEERDENAEVVTTAEENGRPVNDTDERAAQADVPVASDEEPEIVEETPVEDNKIEVKVETSEPTVEDAIAADVQVEEKGVSIADLAKSVETLIAKFDNSGSSELSKLSDAVSAVSDKVEKSIASLEGRIEAIEKQPVPAKTVASYVEVAKGDDNVEVEKSAEVAELIKRRDFLAEHPEAIEPMEAAKLFADLRKAQKSGLIK